MEANSENTTATKTLLVTDSGLGGLSVFVEIVNQLKAASPWQSVRLIYFNAWPESGRGYNHFPDMEMKARVFDSAMTAMGRYQPDRIFIACNTLSVIYPETPFSRRNHIAVTGIVDDGADMIYEALSADPESRVVIFGTPTTTTARSHETRLRERGIAAHRIINQGCIDLAGKIERDPYSDIVPAMIDDNVKQAADRMATSGGKVFGALCCTHFGYCRDRFMAAMEKYISPDAAILNPNETMARRALRKETGTTADPEMSMHIVSRIPWETHRIDAYSRMLAAVSPETVAALKNYELNPELFQVN